MTELTKNLFCILIRGGVEIWREHSEIKKLQELLSAINKSTFVHFGDMTINTADIVGVFDAKTIALHTERKNGRWQCESNFWHERFEKCEHDHDIIKLKRKYGTE